MSGLSALLLLPALLIGALCFAAAFELKKKRPWAYATGGVVVGLVVVWTQL